MNLGPSIMITCLLTSLRRVGSPPRRPGELALTTVMQCAEGLSDRQAADAVCSRIDWQYALSVELTDPGFDHTVAWRPCSSVCRAALTPATRRRSTATSPSASLARTTGTARDTLPHWRHDNRPALGVAIGVGVRFRPVRPASAGSLPVSGHARQGRRIRRRPVRASQACRQDPGVPGAAPARAAAEIVACRSVVPVWPRYREDGLRP